MKISFKSDYAEGCHPNILKSLQDYNLQQELPYGNDSFSLEAKQLIKNKLNAPNAAVHFVSGGTQANLLVASAFLKPYESMISAQTGHIYNNEAGAIEATGHKVNSIFTESGKLTPTKLEEVLNQHTNAPHQVKPKMVYISNATELGTLYSKKELFDLHDFCQKNDLYLFMDGARLGSALMATTNDVQWQDLANFCDAFYIGGTKNGALMGEAIVILNEELQPNFEFILKQHGALLSKGRLLGIQFLELFKNDLFSEMAGHANAQAEKIKNALKEKNIPFLVETYTNQLFPILSNEQIKYLSNFFDFYVWKSLDDDNAAIRLITSWATPDEYVKQFIHKINEL